MMGGWKKDSLCYWKMEVGGRFRNAWSTFAKKQEQSLGKQFTLRNNRRKAILSKLLKYSTWIFIIQIQFLDHYLSSYRLGDCTQWKTSNGGWISANEFSKPYLFQDRVTDSVLLLALPTMFKWCFKMHLSTQDNDSKNSQACSISQWFSPKPLGACARTLIWLKKYWCTLKRSRRDMFFWLSTYKKKKSNITSLYIRLSVYWNGTKRTSLRAFQCQ